MTGRVLLPLVGEGGPAKRGRMRVFGIGGATHFSRMFTEDFRLTKCRNRPANRHPTLSTQGLRSPASGKRKGC
jgi:hypothetical protein